MSETQFKQPERVIDANAKASESKVFTDDHGLGNLTLSEIQKLNSQSSKNSDWTPITDEKTANSRKGETLLGENSPETKGSPQDSGAKDGRIGLPEDAPAFKAYERLNPRIQDAFPGDDEKSAAVRRAALDYLMHQEGYGDQPKPEQIELLKNTPRAFDKLDRISWDEQIAIGHKDSKSPTHLDMGGVEKLF